MKKKFILLAIFCSAGLLIQAQTFTFGDLQNWANGESTDQAASTQGDVLTVGQRLADGQKIWSPSKSHFAEMQPDGNFCIYTSAKKWVWCLGMYETGNYIKMQPDGNLCMYTKDDGWKWCSKTNGKGATSLSIDDSGKLHLKDASGTSVWTN